MKTLSPFKLGFTFAGCFLGAGYVSGQELWQFFSSFGKIGYLGLVLSMVLMFIFGYIIMRVAQKSGIKEMDRIIISQDMPGLRSIIGILQSFFIFGIVVIMCAGTGALINQIFGLPAYFGSGCFAILLAVLACKGVTGLVNILSTLVPLLVLCTVIISIIAIFQNGIANLTFPQSETTNPLLSNWLIAAVTYVTYNLFCGIGILTPVSHLVDNKKITAQGVAFGSIVLWIIATCIFFAMASDTTSLSQELPMLALSCSINNFFGYLYAVLLLCGMLGASLSGTVAILNYAGQKFQLNERKRPLLIFLLVAIAWCCSLFGFGDLISVIYPICGYFGCFALLMVTVHYFKLKIKN